MPFKCRPLPVLLLIASIPAWAQPTAPLTLEQVMADPDWIGPPVEDAWWRWDGRAVEYQLKREGTGIRDTWRQSIDGKGLAVRVNDADRGDLDASGTVYDRDGRRSAFARNGDIFVRELRSGALQQLTRTSEAESRPQWADDGGLVWRAGNDWYRWNGRQVQQAAAPRAEDAPGKPPEADALRDRQFALLRTLKDDKARRDAAREQDEHWARTDPTRAPLPLYLGKDVRIADSALSPDGRWLLVVTQQAKGDAGKEGQMPKYVTESGYEEFEEVRTRVGRNPPLPHALWLADLRAGTLRQVAFDALPGIGADPLAALRKAAGKKPLEGNRAVRVETDGDGTGPAIHWSGDSRQVAVLLRAVDNKDRWIVGVDTATAKLQLRHRLQDAAWINWGFNEFGWLPDGRLWYLSEENGFSHLYVLQGTSARALTRGRWEASAIVPSRDGRGFYFVCNPDAPGDYEVCHVSASGGALRQVTALDGVEDFSLSPDGKRLLVRHSSAYLPPQLAVVDVDGDTQVRLTDTRKPAFKAIDWIAPQVVQVPSRHGAGVIHGKYYGPATPEPGRQYPIVLFVHGAGYLQNVSARYPNYFREQMFHNLLVQRGYIVLDLDYRASEGYGRDWRTAIYRHMGKPELEDYLDGLEWLVANKQGDRDRVGIYGGSYGGFLTFMALFKQPGVFKAGAALRPVSDWTQYNHEYTSNILNTPDIDPESYTRSSPLDHAAGLQDHLLIAHGMLDDNVFYKDSVMLAQRLIELRKDKWELASYPLERHGYVRSDSWYDQYRRILELFERTLK